MLASAANVSLREYLPNPCQLFISRGCVQACKVSVVSLSHKLYERTQRPTAYVLPSATCGVGWSWGIRSSRQGAEIGFACLTFTGTLREDPLEMDISLLLRTSFFYQTVEIPLPILIAIGVGIQ